MIYENIIKLLKFRVNKVNKLFFLEKFMWNSINAETFGSLSRRVLWFVINYVNFKLKTTSDSDIFGLSVVAKTIAFVSSW